MSNDKDKLGKDKKKVFNSVSKSVVNDGTFLPATQEARSTKKLHTRSVRHYPFDTVNIIKNSLNIIKPKLDKSDSVKQNDREYISAVKAIDTALLRLASSLVNILTDDPGEDDNTNHHDLLANFFQMPGTDNNGVHLVATSNIEALSEDLKLHKNTREYNWLMSNGVSTLEYELLNKIHTEMSDLERGQSNVLGLQHERAIELQNIHDKEKS